MATIDDIGVPGQPMNNPPLTPWQAAVRDELKAERVRVRAGTATANASGQVTLVFSPPFTQNPVLVATTIGAFGIVAVQSATTSGATLAVTTAAGAVIPSALLGWVAVGAPPAATLLPAEEA